MILVVYLDHQQPTRVHETYTFNFSYPFESISTPAVRVSKRNKNSFDHEQAYQCYHQIIKQIKIATKSLAPLPEKFFLTLKLRFDETCTPSNYSMKQFRATIGNDQLWYHSTPEIDSVIMIGYLANSSSRTSLKPVN